MKHRPHASLLLLGALAALFPLLHGCAGRGPAPAQTASRTVRFAYQDRVADAVSMIAVEKGFFRAEGIEVEPLVFSSGPACSETLLSGSADIGTMGDTTAVIAVARSPVKIIASHGGGEHRHRIVVASDSSIERPSDLIGRRLAVKKGTSTYGGLLSWAESEGVDLSRVKVIELAPDDMPDAVASGAVEAIAASEPTPSVIEARGGRQLATLGGLGNSYPILLVARSRFLEAEPETVVRFLRALRRASAFMAEHGDEAALTVAAKTGLSVETARRAMSHHYYTVQLDADTLASLRGIADFLVSQDMLEAPPDLSQTVDDTFLKAAGEQ